MHDLESRRVSFPLLMALLLTLFLAGWALGQRDPQPRDESVPCAFEIDGEGTAG